MSRELLIEKMARAIGDADMKSPISDLRWDRMRGGQRRYEYELFARAVLSLLSDPANITPEMVMEARKAYARGRYDTPEALVASWKALIAAAFSERAP